MQQETKRSHQRESELQRQLDEAVITTKPETNFHVSDKFLDTSSHDEHIEALKQQLKMSRDATNAKEDALVSCHEELAETKLSLDHYGAVNNELQNDNTRLNERLRELSRRYDDVDKEIVASRTSVDFNALQINEKDNFIGRLQEEIEKLEQEKRNNEKEKAELMKAEQRNLDSLKKVHEKEVQSLQASLRLREDEYKDDIDKLIQQHSYELEKCMHDGRQSLEKESMEHSSLIQQLKSEGMGESFKQREELNAQIFEKEAEILRLQGVIDLEKAHCETHKSTIEELKKQLAVQISDLEGTTADKSDMLRKYDAVSSALEVAQADAKKYDVVIDSLNVELQREREAVDAQRAECKEAKSSITSLEAQLDMCKNENETLKQLTSGVEDNSRENERLKSMLQACKEDLVDMTAERDQTRMTEKITQDESSKKDELILMANAEVKRLGTKVDALDDELHKYQQLLHSEQSKVTSLEATVAEQREASAVVKGDLEKLRAELIISEQRVSAESFNSQTCKASFEKSCSRMLQAMIKWDVQLTPVLEGYTGQEGVSSYVVEIPLSLDDILCNSDELFQNSVAVVERIQYKMDRILKIRDIFMKSSQKLLSDMDRKFDTAQDKTSIMSYRVKDVEEKSKQISHDLKEDVKRKEMNAQDMKSFQHTIVTEHVNELKEAEERASNLTTQLQSERHNSEKLERDLLVLKDENSALRSERYEIGQTESAVSSLSEKFQTMAESNRLMSLEIEERGQSINKLNDTIQGLTSEKNALLSGVQRLTSQIEMRDQMISGHESNVDDLKREILILKNRQINPELEKSIIDSQNVLRSSISNFNAQIHEKDTLHAAEQNADESALTSVLLTDNAMTSSIQSMFSKLSDFVDSVSSLSKKSEKMLQQYENIQLTGGQDRTSIENDMFELLDANSRLSSKLLQLAIDFKRLSRKALLHSNEELHPYDGSNIARTSKPTFEAAETKSDFNLPPSELDLFGHGKNKYHDEGDVARGASLGIESLSGPYDSPLRPGDSAYTPMASHLQQHSHKSFSHITATPSGHESSLNRGSQRSYSPSRTSSFSPSHVDYSDGRKSSPHSVKFMNPHSRLSFESQAQSHGNSHFNQRNHFSLSSSGSHNLHVSGESQQHHLTQSDVLRNSQSSFQRGSSRDSTVLPGSRLAKLGSDLQNLAGKLDSFNAKSKSTSKFLQN